MKKVTSMLTTTETILVMIYKLGMCAEKRWRHIRGFTHLAKVFEGVKFKDGIEISEYTEENRNAD